MKARPTIDLSELTAEHASPMNEATQRVAKAASPPAPLPKSITRQAVVKERNSEPLNFNVTPLLAKRFRKAAFDADLFLNQLLEEALDAWEARRGIKSQKS
jgi:hypothetical protein